MEALGTKDAIDVNLNNGFINYGDQSPSKLYSTLNGDYSSVYYGVHIPPDVQVQDNDGYINVFQDKNEALKVVKKYKKARFKAFGYYHEAAEFAVQGSENPNNNASTDGSFLQKQVQEGNAPSVGEKPSQFRGPTSQNLVKLRKGIETGDIHFVQTTIWDNPRYLIGNGDTPSILQEGFRYNGLHVAAKSKNPAMCELILNTISNIAFIKKLYVDDKNPEERAKILLDLYLNTPDKGLHETPLHFAVKFGAAKCVEMLVSYPQCDKNLRNKHGKLVNQIICERYDGPDRAALVKSITASLQENFYVPVLRAEDNCAPPVIGEPFCPMSPPNFNQDPLSPRLEIHAYAGPMNREGATKFRKLWKTPPRAQKLGLSKKENRSMDSLALLKMKDHEKGLERLGNNLAQQMEVGWKEYWPFLDSFVDIASREGLELFEAYLTQKMNNLYPPSLTPSPQSSHNSPKDHSGANSPPKLNTEVSPITDLCRALQACSLKDNGKYYTSSFDLNKEGQNDLCPFFYVDKSLQVFAKRISNDIIYLLDVQYDTCTVLEMQIKQLQLLMASYMDDNRFASVDFHLVHARLSYLIKSILKHVLQDFKSLDKMLDLWQEFCSKNYDCFSSDDEGVQNTVVHSKSQHTLCILKNTQEYITADVRFEDIKTEEDCIRVWKQLKSCSCVWQNKVGKKIFGSKRSNSFKFSSKNSFKIENISRKLSFNENDPEIFNSKPNLLSNGIGDHDDSDEDVSSDDEQFFTPPSTPSLLEDKSDDENDFFDETNLPETEVFIEGDFPTKVDCAVFNAINYADCKLNPKDFPNVYRWHHAVNLYNDCERTGWLSPSIAKCNLGPPQVMSTPIKMTQKSEQCITSPPYTPSKSWLRITGANSPRASLKCQRGNVSFNL